MVANPIKPAVGDRSGAVDCPTFVPEGLGEGTTTDIVDGGEFFYGEIVFMQLNQRIYSTRAVTSSGHAEELAENTPVGASRRSGKSDNCQWNHESPDQFRLSSHFHLLGLLLKQLLHII